MVERSAWSLNEDGEIDFSYSDLARNLGGCPENLVSGRFKVLSILTTATALNFVSQICNVTRDESVQGAPLEVLLPAEVSAGRAVDGALAGQIAAHQYQLFFGRAPTPVEAAEATAAGTQCAQSSCSAEEFARPACFALLSSAELLFY